MNIQSAARTALGAAVFLGLAACAADPGDDLGDRLEARLVLPAMQAGDLHLITTMSGEEMPAVEPAVTGGELVVRTSGAHLVLEELSIRLGDVDIVKTYGSVTQTFPLTDLRLRLGTQADAAATWSDDRTQVDGTAYADLLLDWGLRGRDGVVVPLATQRIHDVELALHVALDATPGGAGGAVASLDGEVLGQILNFGDIRVRDLSFSLVAAETP